MIPVQQVEARALLPARGLFLAGFLKERGDPPLRVGLDDAALVHLGVGARALHDQGRGAVVPKSNFTGRNKLNVLVVYCRGIRKTMFFLDTMLRA